MIHTQTHTTHTKWTINNWSNSITTSKWTLVAAAATAAALFCCLCHIINFIRCKKKLIQNLNSTKFKILPFVVLPFGQSNVRIEWYVFIQNKMIKKTSREKKLGIFIQFLIHMSLLFYFIVIILTGFLFILNYLEEKIKHTHTYRPKW